MTTWTKVAPAEVGVESGPVAAVRLAPRTNVENASRSAIRWS